ncbi:acyl-CoA dehydrogenase [uncultured Umboniibacter sp.]|uniref:acyl-CoA dehydrogenase n=1 Tax=uncultured Umboniibacter sp. TaxID=1798917 RepID=UPI00262DBABC|nr:acyl-CoA dehydrogenase [uncultured Umboniibacter sp.]
MSALNEMQFLLRDVFQLENSWQGSELFADYTAELGDAILSEAEKFAREALAPINRSGDEEGCRLEADGVHTPSGFVEAWAAFSEGGWPSMAGDPVWGGQGMPKALSVMADELFYSANSSFMLYSTLSVGAALCIDAHASESLKKTYLPALYEGRWAGVMDLTEPHAGSDLGLLRTKAQDLGNGEYAIEGNKMFITGGDQDMTENVIHLVLARLEGAPAGYRGISLFLVPKFHVNDDGSLGEQNAVIVGSIEHKMGINASATCVVNFDGAKGYLVGEANRGLQAMFTMMNYERLSIGVQGLASGVASYDSAMTYAAERKQGSVAGELTAINRHADVKRMLLTMRVMADAGRALAVYAAHCLDCSKSENSAAMAQRAALLTPVVKAFLTDQGFESCVIGQQVFGGHGYVREWGQEQWVRDARIAQIYEGTNGIQAQDLVKRKVCVDGGSALKAMLDDFSSLTPDSTFVSASQQFLTLSEEMVAVLTEHPQREGAISVDYLHALGYLSYHHFLLRMVAAATGDDVAVRQQRMQFFEMRIMPRFNALLSSIKAGLSVDLVL